jgi:hypothetical protein
LYLRQVIGSNRGKELIQVTTFINLAFGISLAPKSEDGAKMVTLLLTGLPFELDHGVPWFNERVTPKSGSGGIGGAISKRQP